MNVTEKNDSELRVIAVVQFNKGEALVLNRPINFTYEQVGKDFIGTDGPFTYPLFYSHGSGNFRAFAGREMTLNMKDGSQQKIKDHWWAGVKKGLIDIVISDVESLKKCYVFGSAQMTPEEYQALRDSYTGCVYPYWDYEKVISYVDMRIDLHRKIRREEMRVKSLISEAKKNHNCADGLRQQILALTAENTSLKEVLEYAVNPDNAPEYHRAGMGCGVEDRGYQKDGYSACEYGWDSALDRMYSEVLPDVLPETPATDRFSRELKAKGVEEFAAFCGEENSVFVEAKAYYRSLPDAADEFAQQLRGEEKA